MVEDEMDMDGANEGRNEMGASQRSDGREDAQVTDGGILASLPRTRPQRPSPRRAAAQAQGAGRGPGAKRPRAARGSTAAGARRSATRKTGAASRSNASTGGTAARKAQPPRREPPAPKQGYEPEDDLELGRSVHPPSGVELVESVADVFVELASAGLKAGGRALKDALSPLRR